MWTEEEFVAWKHHPATQGFLWFLAEVRQDLRERWSDGEEMTPHQQSMAQTYGDIVELDYGETVRPFYVAAGLLSEITEEEDSDDVSE